MGEFVLREDDIVVSGAVAAPIVDRSLPSGLWKRLSVMAWNSTEARNMIGVFVLAQDGTVIAEIGHGEQFSTTGVVQLKSDGGFRTDRGSKLRFRFNGLQTTDEVSIRAHGVYN